MWNVLIFTRTEATNVSILKKLYLETPHLLRWFWVISGSTVNLSAGVLFGEINWVLQIKINWPHLDVFQLDFQKM